MIRCVLSHVRLCNLLDRALQVSLSLEFSSQEQWSGLPCPPPGDIPYPGIRTPTPASPALQADSLLLSHHGSPGTCIVNPLQSIRNRHLYKL